MSVLQARRIMATTMLDEVYEETKEITEQALDAVPGKKTLGIDGHKMGKRHVETLTQGKLGISSFLHSEHMGISRATGENLSKLVKQFLTTAFIAVVADNTGNNTGASTGLFACLKLAFATLLCLGCWIHALDLLIEDLAKIKPIADAGHDAHFLTSFIKKHGLLFEEFLLCQKKLGVTVELVLFPLTRFAYLYLMCLRCYKNYSALRLVSESPVYAVVKQQLKKRGQEGKKALEEFERFEELTASRRSREKIGGVSATLGPFSHVLHYGEGDSVPVSHVLPCFQLCYDFSQQLNEYTAITAVLEKEEHHDEFVSAVRDRWLGEGRKVGVKNDVHLCSFGLDPYAQAILTTPEDPDCDLLSGEVWAAARRVLRQLAGDDAAKRSVLLQQLGLWQSACPQINADAAGPSRNRAAQAGNNAYSSLYLSAMELMWDKVEARQTALQDRDELPDADVPGFDIKEAVDKLKLSPKPTGFWLEMQRETPRGAKPEAIEAHKLFCKMACDILSIVGHTCGVERAGKGYGLVLGPLRKSMDPARAKKAIYVFENYGLLNHKQVSGDGYDSFVSSLLDEDEVTAAGAGGIRRGNLIMEDAPESEQESEDEADAAGAATSEVKWRIPDGFTVAPKPSAIDKACVGRFVFLKWATFGWQLGKVGSLVTKSTPRLFKKFNVRVTWADGEGPCKLDLPAYRHGDNAPTDSWVFLTPKQVE